MCLEIKANTEMLEWARHQAITRLVCLTDSMSFLTKISTDMLHADLVCGYQLEQATDCWWIFCPVHCGISDNKFADALTGQATIESMLTFDPDTVLSLVCEKI